MGFRQRDASLFFAGCRVEREHVVAVVGADVQLTLHRIIRLFTKLTTEVAMPMLDVYIPAGALDPDDEHRLMETLTDTLLRWEGADPSNARARSLAWVFLHRPAAVLVAGELPLEPVYRVVASVPEGQLDDERRAGMVAEVTANILDAEPAGRSRDPFRVWVLAGVVPEGTWGGQVFRLADIAALVVGDASAGAAHAKRRLAIAKAERDAIFS